MLKMIKPSAPRLLVAVPVLTLALMFASLVGPIEVAAQKGAPVPGYALQVLPTPPGFTRASVLGINDNHEVVGTVGAGFSRLAAYWSSVDAAPVLLPCPTAPCVAQAINATGMISGTVNFQAVVWRLNGGMWFVEALRYPGTGDPAYYSSAGGLLDDGTTVGAYRLAYGPMYPHEVPVRWSPSGTLSEYPVSEGFFAGSATGVNQDGDATGEQDMKDAQGLTWAYGVIWIRQDDGTYLSVVLGPGVNGITPRFADGSFLVSSSAGRLRVSLSGSYFVESSVDGGGAGINRLGDMVGFLPKKGWTGYGGMPYLLRLDETLIRLPIPSGTTGTASCVSTDRWVGGDFKKQGVYSAAVWRPQ